MLKYYLTVSGLLKLFYFYSLSFYLYIPCPFKTWVMIALHNSLSSVTHWDEQYPFPLHRIRKKEVPLERTAFPPKTTTLRNLLPKACFRITKFLTYSRVLLTLILPTYPYKKRLPPSLVLYKKPHSLTLSLEWLFGLQLEDIFNALTLSFR